MLYIYSTKNKNNKNQKSSRHLHVVKILNEKVQNLENYIPSLIYKI